MAAVIDRIVTELTDEFYAESKTDIVGLWEIAAVVSDEASEAEAVMDISIKVIRALLGRGLRPAYSPYDANHSGVWEEQTIEEVIERIRSEWIKLGRFPDHPDIVCFVGPKLSRQ